VAAVPPVASTPIDASTREIRSLNIVWCFCSFDRSL